MRRQQFLTGKLTSVGVKEYKSQTAFLSVNSCTTLMQ